MHWLKKQKTKKLLASLLLSLFLSVGVFGFAPETHAFPTGGQIVEVASWFSSGDDSCNFWCAPFKWLLYAVLVVFQVFASAALVLFEYVIKPGHIVGLMNLPAVVELWRFVRDFFNLFFILVLLFSAFATIFQVEQYSLKKLFLSILLGALLVNFSFPITRFLVDTTNVPMYYFANSISPTGTAGGGTGSGFGTILSASELTELVVPQGKKARETPFMALLQGVIFMFLFAITTLVLSVMMFIRVIGLVILLIFSPVGFISSAIPGLQKYGSEWWEKFWKYALFGPVAMLMLMVAVKFMAAVKESGVMSTPVKSLVTDVTAGSDTTNIMAMVLFSLPMILIWMSIGIANSFSIAGAGAVTGWGQKFAKWGGSQAIRGGKWVGYKNPIARGVGGGVKDRFDNNRFVKFFKSPSKTEARIKGALGTGTVKGELDAIHHKAAYEEAEKMKKGNVSNSTLTNNLKGQDKVKATAAAMILSERKAIDTADDFSLALAALGSNTKEVASLINAASSDALKIDTTTPAGADKYEKLVTSGAFYTNSKLREQLENKIKKEGHAKVLIDQEINKTSAAGASPVSRQDIYDKYLNKMTAEDIAKMKGVHGDSATPPKAEIIAFVTNQVGTGNWTPKDHTDAYSKLTAEQKEAWRKAKISP